MDDMVRDMMAHFTALPRKGTPAADLTDRDRLALAIAAGAPTEVAMDGTQLTIRTTVPVGVADRGDGGYIVAIGATPPQPGDSGRGDGGGRTNTELCGERSESTRAPG